MSWMGFDEFIWFFGVVEDRDDPQQLGRVRVRCVGIHTNDKEMIPTKDLPWAMVMMPVTSASVSGVGETPLGLVEGSWVMGFFRDGKEAQEPVVMGSFVGIPQNLPNKNIGFNDPNGVYPKPEYVNAQGEAEPDTNKRARGDGTTRINKGFESADPYAAQYPKCHTRETESGHILEFDDTSNSERIKVQHGKHESFIEFYPDGSIVIRTAKDRFETVDGSLNVYVEGNANMIVRGDCDTKVNGIYRLESDESITLIAPRINLDGP
jgi:hypothetical protein